MLTIFFVSMSNRLTSDLPDVVPKQNVAKQGDKYHADPAAVIPTKCHDHAWNYQHDLQKQDGILLSIASPIGIFLLVYPQLLDSLIIDLGKAVIDKADADID